MGACDVTASLQDGDVAGPWFARTPSGLTQLGVVSYGLGCGVPTFPGVYSEVNETGIRACISQHAGV